jgi:hypothetical protein
VSAISMHAEVFFGGEIEVILSFYKALGVPTTENGVLFKDLEMYFSDIPGTPQFQFVIELDDDLARLERKVKAVGGSIVERGFDMSGPFLIVKDPAGTQVRIGVSIGSLKNA